jgi:hypothetical protein
MKNKCLHFKWDPRANKKASPMSLDNKNCKKKKSLEDYFDFIEQFKYSSDKNKPDQHVDKKFSLIF